MSDFDEQFDQAATPEVVNPPAVVDQHREHVRQHIANALTKHLEAIANKKYDTKVVVTAADAPMTLNVNIQTNDPRVIAALAAGD